jgi:hypothetical protein
MVLPNSNDLKAKISKEDPGHTQRLENLKSSLKLAYKSVAQANRNSHLNNKGYTIAELSCEALRWEIWSICMSRP